MIWTPEVWQWKTYEPFQKTHYEVVQKFDVQNLNPTRRINKGEKEQVRKISI